MTLRQFKAGKILVPYSGAKGKTKTKNWEKLDNEFSTSILGHWWYLSRLVNKSGNIVDFRLNKRRQKMSDRIFLIKSIGNNGKLGIKNIKQSGLNS